MTITTYAGMQTAIGDFLNRTDLTATIPTFIALAEASIGRDLRHWQMECRSVAVIDAQFSEVPSDWLETLRFNTTDQNTAPLELISQAEMIDRRAAAANVGGRPQFYTHTAGQFEFLPTPDAAYNAQLIYTARIPALSASNVTNWLLTEAPDVYLYGSLVHTAPYLKEDARATTWAAMYQSAIRSLQLTSDKAKTSGAGLRVKIRGLS